MKMSRSEQIYSRINRILLIVIIVSNTYVLLSPLLPEFSFRLKHIQAGASAQIDYSSLDTSKNLLIVPDLGLTEEIHEGKTVQTVNLGVWRRPNTSTPTAGHNTVLVGHRFTYDGASVFYHLDKLKPGNKLHVLWNGSLKQYTVKETKVVPATAVEIEARTSEEILTLYTCTPLWTAKDRLVVIAAPENTDE